MDFVEIKVLQAEAVLLQQARNGIRRRHQQPFALVDKVHRRDFAGVEPGQYRQIVGRRPRLAGQQHHRGAIGER
ncbi:hypothetical protein D3C78_1592370 [compost metagenome]